MGLSQETPATPLPWFDIAATVPDTMVPCPRVSKVSGDSSTKFHPGTVFGARSGWVRSIPESNTPIVTVVDPVVVSHANGAWIPARCHC